MAPHLPGPPRAYSDQLRGHGGGHYYQRRPFLLERPVVVMIQQPPSPAFRYELATQLANAAKYKAEQADAFALGFIKGTAPRTVDTLKNSLALIQQSWTQINEAENTYNATNPATDPSGVQAGIALGAIAAAQSALVKAQKDLDIAARPSTGPVRAFAGVGLGAAPVVPNTNFRSDVFLTGLSDGSGGFNAGIPAKEVATCWTGSDKSSELVRVWRAPSSGGWPGGSASDPFNSATNKQLDDVWAIPTSWGDPDATTACWSHVQSTARTIDVDSSGKSYTSRQWQPASVVLKAYVQALGLNQFTVIFYAAALANAGMTSAFITAGASCPKAVDAALKAGTLPAIIKSSTPGTFCAKLAAGTGPAPGVGTTAQKYMNAISGGGLVLAALLQACKDAGLDAGLATTFGDAGAACPALVRDALQAKVVTRVLTLKRPSTFCADLRAALATKDTKAPAKQPSDAAYKAYTDVIGSDMVDVANAFFDACNPGDVWTDQCIAFFEAGSKCPVVVNDARKAGKLAGVVAKSTPATLCADLVKEMGGTTEKPTEPDGVPTWLKIGIGASVISATIGVVAFLERHKGPKKNPTRSGHMTKAEAVAEFRRSIDSRYGRDDKPARREAWNNWTDGLLKDGEITRAQYDSWGFPSGL